MGCDLDKESFREVARSLRPDIDRPEFDRAWARFEALRLKAAALRAAGVAIHPTFGRDEGSSIEH